MKATRADTIKGHAKDLDRLFNRASAKGFSFSIEKTSIAKPCVQYLGLLMGSGNVCSTRKTQENLDKLFAEAAITKDEKYFMRYWGFLQFSSRFLPNLSKHRVEINKFRDKISKQKNPELGKAERDAIIETANKRLKEI